MKKGLSILLALLMILSSLPIMTFAASAEQADPNVMADYTYANWQARRWGSSNEGTESLNGGTSIYLKSVNYQKAFTTVTLEPNTTYLLDFNWKSDTNESLNGLAIRHIFVFAESTYGSNEALLAPAQSTALESYAGSGTWHHDNGDFYPAGATGTLTSLGADLESATADTTPRINATAGTWQHVSTTFTTNSTDTNYAIMLDLVPNSTGAAGPNTMHLSDFRLITTADSEAIAIEDKIANDWFPFQHSKIYDDTSFTQDGITSDFRVEKPVYQKISTVVELDANTVYNFDFDYYSVVHASGNPYIESIRIFDYASGSVLDAGNWTAEADYNKSYTDIENGGSYGSADNAGSWQHITTQFTTTAATKYNITICFRASGFNDAQKVYLANFKLDTLVAKKPGNILNNANYANGDVSWTTATGQNMDARMSFSTGLDNPAFSLNGGYAWGFGFGYGDLVGENYGYVYIKAKGLKADATYDFSYIYVNDFRFKIDSIKNDTATVTEYIVEPTIEAMADYKAEKVSALFKVPADGDYTITLKSNRDEENRMSWITWSTTYLCDLELYERGAMYDVSVSKEGNGFVKADKTGLTEKGTSVTFTAKAETYEQFLGWYVGDELVSEDLTYTATVEGALAPVAKFTTNSENLMADYTASNFGAMPNGSVADSPETNYGGNGVHAAKVPHQNFFTTVSLEAGKEYTFGFSWKSEANIYNKAYPNTISVFQKAAGDPFDASSWDDSKWPPYQGDTTTYPDIENGGAYTTQDLANTCTWQNLATSFTPTETTEYVIMIAITFAMQDLGDGVTKHYNNNQGIYFSDFVLKETYVDESNIAGQISASDWATWNYSVVSDYSESRYGGKSYYVDRSMYQSIATELALKPGTDYEFSFQWKAVANESGNAYPAGVGVYSANSGTIPPAKTLYNNTEAESPYPANGYENLAQNVTYPTVGETVLTEWNTLSGNFTTAEDANYYFTLYFNRDGSANNDQKLIISDFVLKEVVKGTAPAADEMIDHPGVSIRKASESTYGQALRYKFTIDGTVIDNAQTDGYELVEYGTVVALADALVGHAADPILSATAYTVRTGVAYNVDDGTNIQFAVDDNGDVTYTAALYNIPTANYSSSLAVRPYAKFRNAEGDTYIRYGTTRFASVFEVVQEILAGSNTEDIDYVNNTLLSGDIKTAYDAWVNEQ